MGTVATPFVPSTTNTTGTAIGFLAGGMAVKWLVAAPFVLKLCSVPFLAFLGLTPIGLAGMIGVGVTSLVGYGVTHVAELREINAFIAALPKTYAAPTDFPAPKDGAFDKPPVAQGQSNSNINSGG